MATGPRRAEWTDYSLLDAGDGRRLERFGARVVDRPAPTATEPRGAPAEWAAADLRFEHGGSRAGGGWAGPGAWTGPGGAALDEPALAPWPVSLHGLVLELRPISSGGLGVYPEHRANLAWLEDRVRERLSTDGRPSVLNLFAHTGLATLAAARAGAAVTHVDGARGAVAWARRNAELSDLADRPIRWLVDDAATFAAREARRERRYDGIILDPPSFGHARARRWRLEDELPDLLVACARIAADDAFLLLSAHTTGLDGTALGSMVRQAFPSRRASIEGSVLELVAESGARLDLGWSIRMTI